MGEPDKKTFQQLYEMDILFLFFFAAFQEKGFQSLTPISLSHGRPVWNSGCFVYSTTLTDYDFAGGLDFPQ